MATAAKYVFRLVSLPVVLFLGLFIWFAMRIGDFAEWAWQGTWAKGFFEWAERGGRAK